ncbi:MAG: KpsF/GutQ family sugar-phosphate isomerase [Planctomycetes bacterium]|nr:KpsF/GutQ family sugar-phosphate isomerase [Planctomycetota bacterium]
MPARDAIEVGRQVIRDEAEALRQAAADLGSAFGEVVRLLLDPRCQVIVSGIGKSGNIAAKIAASLTSTGTPAVFMHPVEALHGDLGIVTGQHCLIALSRSGNTDELLRFAVHFKRLGGPVIAITQSRDSRLSELATHTLLLPDLPEAGPHNLAPTTSCIMQLAIGDALTMALWHARGFSPEDFARYHPEGALGRRLLLRAEDLMVAGERVPCVAHSAPFENLLFEMSGKALGLALIVEPDGRLLGVFTDGDLRRLFQRVSNPRGLTAREAHAQSRRSPDAPPVPVSTVNPHKPAVDCLQLMRDAQITSLVVADEAGRPIGLLRVMDLIAAGL